MIFFIRSFFLIKPEYRLSASALASFKKGFLPVGNDAFLKAFCVSFYSYSLISIGGLNTLHRH